MNRLRVVLAEKNLQNKWLSEKLGVGQATVSKWVTNTTQPSLEQLLRIADDVNVLYPKFDMNVYSAMFLVTLIEKEKYRFCYGRKWQASIMKETVIKLPIAKNGEPDWSYIENYIKGLDYSNVL